VTTAGQRHDSVAFDAVMAGVSVRRPGPGRPRTRPDRLLGDKAYSNTTIRAALRRRGIVATIPEPDNQKNNRARRGRRHPRNAANARALQRNWDSIIVLRAVLQGWPSWPWA
jgi:hypothetical protein